MMKINSVNNIYNISFGTKREFKRLFKTCAYSGEDFAAHDTKTIEHIKPLSLGGENGYSNYIVVKRSWNEKRSSKPLGEFIKENPQVEENIVKTVNSLDGQTVDGIDWAQEVRKSLTEEIGRDIFIK